MSRWFGEKAGALGGDSFVGITEYPLDGTRPYGRTCIGYGNASPGSRGAKVFGHQNDQYELFYKKELKPALREYDEVIADMEEMVTVSY